MNKIFSSERNGICTRYGARRYRKNFMQNENNHLFGKAFGNEVGISYNSDLTHRSTNVLVVGGGGTGKTYNYIEPNLLQANHSAVVVDVGGVLYKRCGDYLRKKGYNVYCIDFADNKDGCRLNPFLNRNAETCKMMIDTITNSFVIACKNNIKELPAYEQAVYSALSRVVLGYTFHSPLLSTGQRNFKYVQTIVDELQRSGKSIIHKYGCGTLLNNEICFLKTVPDEIFSKVAISLIVDLNAFVLSDKEVFTEPKNALRFSVEDFVSKRSCLFIKTTFQRNSCVSFLISQIFNCLRFYAEVQSSKQCDAMTMDSIKLKNHVQFYLDEFANLNLGNFIFALSVCRPYNIGFSIVIQSFEQLIQKYGDDWESIDANVDTHLFMGTCVASDLKRIETLVGKHGLDGTSVPILKVEELLKIYKVQRKIVAVVRDCHPFVCDKLNPDDYKE